MLGLVASLLVSAAPAPMAALDVRGDASCITASSLAREVAARLGRDPFDALAARKANVSVRARTRGWSVELVMREPDGHAGRRVLEDADCDALSLALALTLAIAIDPLGVDRPRYVRSAWAVRARDLHVEPAPRRDPEPTPVYPPRPRPPPWSLGAGLGVEVSAGLAPEVLVGPLLRAEVASARWTIGLEAALALAGAARVDVTRVTTRMLGVRLDAAYRWARGRFWIGAGVSGWSWAVDAHEGLLAPVAIARFIARFDVELGGYASDHVRLALRLGVPTPRPILAIDGRDVWDAWPLTLGLGLSFGVPLNPP